MTSSMKRWSAAAFRIWGGVKRCVGPGVGICMTVAVGAGIARASTPPLRPPLPAYMPTEDRTAIAEAAYEAEPLPRGGLTSVPTPFRYQLTQNEPQDAVQDSAQGDMQDPDVAAAVS